MSALFRLPKNIEAGLLGEEGRRPSRNCGKVAKMETKTLDVAETWHVNRFDGFDPIVVLIVERLAI